MTKRGDKTRKRREKRGQDKKEKKRGPEEGVGERETIERGKGGWGERERDEIIALLVVCCHSGQIACLSLSLSLWHRLHSRM